MHAVSNPAVLQYRVDSYWPTALRHPQLGLMHLVAHPPSLSWAREEERMVNEHAAPVRVPNQSVHPASNVLPGSDQLLPVALRQPQSLQPAVMRFEAHPPSLFLALDIDHVVYLAT